MTANTTCSGGEVSLGLRAVAAQGLEGGVLIPEAQIMAFMIARKPGTGDGAELLQRMVLPEDDEQHHLEDIC